VEPPRDIERDGFDLILECTGNDEVLLKTAQSLASCGVMVWLGSSRMPESRPHNVDVLMRNAVLRNHVHLGTVNAAPRDFVAAIQHLEQLHEECANELTAVLTERVALQDSLWHYRHRLPQGIKTVVVYR
jgi:threonine dehydrogenase-like Zn-dependent dehydrogenase